MLVNFPVYIMRHRVPRVKKLSKFFFKGISPKPFYFSRQKNPPIIIFVCFSHSFLFSCINNYIIAYQHRSLGIPLNKYRIFARQNVHVFDMISNRMAAGSAFVWHKMTTFPNKFRGNIVALSY